MTTRFSDPYETEEVCKYCGDISEHKWLGTFAETCDYTAFTCPNCGKTKLTQDDIQLREKRARCYYHNIGRQGSLGYT